MGGRHRHTGPANRGSGVMCIHKPRRKMATPQSRVGVQVNLPHTLLQPELVASGPTHAQKANGAAAAGLFLLHTFLLKNQI